MTPTEPTAITPAPASRTVPAWITDPDLIASIEAGLIDIDDEFMGATQ
ncbi:hypothetical protein [Streptomyces fungicidicus]